MSSTITYPAFSPKDPDEIVFVAFDFAALTSAPLTPSVTATRHAGEADASPSAILAGVPSVSGARIVQKITGGIAGCDYSLRCEIDVADGSHYVLAGVLPVRTA
jgi:hypothetical protein